MYGDNTECHFSLEARFSVINRLILSIPTKQLDKINDVFDSFQYFWRECDIFAGMLTNGSVLGTSHHDHDQYDHLPLNREILTNQGSVET